MPRLKEAGRDANNPYANAIFDLLFGDRDPIKEPGTATGTPGNWWTVFNIVPDAFHHTTEGFRFYRDENRKIDPKLRELGQIRAGLKTARLIRSCGSLVKYGQGSRWDRSSYFPSTARHRAMWG